MNRRSLIATLTAAVASLPFRRDSSATARCTTGNCSGNQRCCAGYTCTPTGNGNSKTCRLNGEPTPVLPPAVVPCEGDDNCPNATVCHVGVCCEAINIDLGGTTQIVYIPITIIVPPAGHHHRHHHHHNRRNRHQEAS
jgi:hypothetical protein